METKESKLNPELKGEVVTIFSDFMTRVTKLEEQAAIGNRFLVNFQQGLEFIRRPPIDKKSELFERIIKANETKRIQSYIEAGCVNTSDKVDNLNKLHASHIGLLNNLSEAKVIINELECLAEDVRRAIEVASESLPDLHHNDNGADLDLQPSICSEEETMPSDPEKPAFTKPAFTDYATMMAVVYSMLKQDYVMQEKIVSSLNLETSSGELESYCLMWSLHPFINDEVMHQAWRLIL